MDQGPEGDCLWEILLKPKTAKRIVLPEFAQSPEQAVNELLVLEACDPPKPEKLKPTDVIVATKSAAVSFVDFIMMTGQYQHMASPPYVPGLEFSGDVIWAGSEVKQFSVGDRVLSDFMTVGPRSKGNYQSSGGWASHVVAPEHGLRRLPDYLTYDQGASFLANFETAYFALVKRANLQANETVLITGASGASGMAMVQIAKLLGARVIVSGRSSEKLLAAMDQGADFMIAQDQCAEGLDALSFMRESTRAITSGRGVDVVIDTVGGETGYAAMRSLKFEGRMVIVGWASNVSADGGRETFESDRLPTNIMQMKCLQVMGSPMVIYSMTNPEWRAHQLTEIIGWANEGKILPHVSLSAPAEEFQQVASAKLRGAVVGSCVLSF